MPPEVVLIHPPLYGLHEPLSYPPMGLLYLGAALTKNNISTQIVNLAGEPKKESYVEHIPQASWYGITISMPTYRDSKRLIEELKHRDPGVQIMIGGTLPTAMPETMQQETQADYVVTGEAERVIVEILTGKHQPGIVHGGKCYKLDSLPFPARDLLPYDHIFDSKGLVFTGEKMHRSTTLLSSRGCPFECAFCSKVQHLKGAIRFRSAVSVAEEMLQVKERYGCSHFRFIDDQFNANKTRLKELCNLITGQGFRIHAGVRADTLQDLDELRMMKEVGMDYVALGVETADNRILKLINKGETIEQIEQAILNCHRVGIRVKTLLIFGLPGETPESVEMTKAFMRRCKPDSYTLSTFTPLPGSAIWEHPERFGVNVDKERYSGWFYHEPDESDDMPEYLTEEVKAARGPLIQYLRSGEWRR